MLPFDIIGIIASFMTLKEFNRVKHCLDLNENEMNAIEVKKYREMDKTMRNKLDISLERMVRQTKENIQQFNEHLDIFLNDEFDNEKIILEPKLYKLLHKKFFKYDSEDVDETTRYTIRKLVERFGSRLKYKDVKKLL